MISPCFSGGDTPPIFSSPPAAGTINQIARGRSSFVTRSASEVAPIAPSLTRCLTESGERSHTTHSCPFFNSRRTMFAPIRPRPIIPICIVNSFFCTHSSCVRRLEDALNRFMQLRVELSFGLPGGEPFCKSSREARDNAMISAQAVVSFIPRITAGQRNHSQDFGVFDEISVEVVFLWQRKL